MDKISDLEIKAGNILYELWDAMPEPKMSFSTWYYEKRDQSLAEVIKKAPVIGRGTGAR
jgi:hypothetical protein